MRHPHAGQEHEKPRHEDETQRNSRTDATAKNAEKLHAIAKEKGWINSKGQPNISAVLNFLIEMFDLGKKKKEKGHG